MDRTLKTVLAISYFQFRSNKTSYYVWNGSLSKQLIGGLCLVRQQVNYHDLSYIMSSLSVTDDVDFKWTMATQDRGREKRTLNMLNSC